MFGLHDIFSNFVRTNTPYSSRLSIYPIGTRSPDLEYGDKILLPSSALIQINYTDAQYPLMFKICHDKNTTFCSVKEFSAEEGMCYVPRWIMKKLGVLPGDVIDIYNIKLNKARFVKLRFRDGSFGNLSNPRAILENKLKNFSVVARKDRIHIEHLGKEYIIDIVDCQPNTIVDIIETDVEVDIEYAEDPRKTTVIPPSEEKKQVNEVVETVDETPSEPAKKSKTLNKFRAKENHFSGSGHSLLSSSAKTRQTSSAFRRVDAGTKTNQSAYDNKFSEKNKSTHFSGQGHKLA